MDQCIPREAKGRQNSAFPPLFLTRGILLKASASLNDWVLIVMQLFCARVRFKGRICCMVTSLCFA